MANRTNSKPSTAPSRKTTQRTKRRPTLQPNFAPVFTKDEAIESANNALRADHFSAVAMRMTCIILSSTPEDAMRVVRGKKGISCTEEVIKLLDDGEAHLKARLEMMAAARARILWAACHVHGVNS